VGEIGKLGNDGKLYVALPDGVEKEATIKAEDENFFTFDVSGQKYLPHFEVFVRQPWPNYPHDVWDPIYNPQPFGYPFVNIAMHDAGHSWWRLTCGASCDVISRFTIADCSQWLGGTGWGYGPDDTAHIIHLKPYEKEGTGHVYAGDGSETVHRIYTCGFLGPGLIGGLEQTDNLARHPGTWNSATHNCLHELINIGGAVGRDLPPADEMPEFFGFDLPPDDP
jgi:hypothetical protein